MNSYCGPYAVAKILGITTDEGADKIRPYHHGRVLKGVTVIAMGHTLRKHAKIVTFIEKTGETVGTFFARMADKDSPHTWLCFTAGHYFIYRKGMVYENRRDAEVTPWADYRLNKCHFKGAWALDTWCDVSPYRFNDDAFLPPLTITEQVIAARTVEALVAPMRVVERLVASGTKWTAEDKRLAKAINITNRLAKWSTKLKRATTAIKKLTREQKRLERRMAKDIA